MRLRMNYAVSASVFRPLGGSYRLFRALLCLFASGPPRRGENIINMYTWPTTYRQ
jgi:hypothetical protein